MVTNFKQTLFHQNAFEKTTSNHLNYSSIIAKSATYNNFISGAVKRFWLE